MGLRMDVAAAVVRQIAWTDETHGCGECSAAVRHFGILLAPILHHDIVGVSLMTSAKGGLDEPHRRPFDWTGSATVFTGREPGAAVPFNTRRMHRWEIEKNRREQFQMRLQELKGIMLRVVAANKNSAVSSRVLCSFIAQLLREVIVQQKGAPPPLPFSPEEDPARRAARLANRARWAIQPPAFRYRRVAPSSPHLLASAAQR